jgi:hypothetical protein
MSDGFQVSGESVNARQNKGSLTKEKLAHLRYMQDLEAAQRTLEESTADELKIYHAAIDAATQKRRTIMADPSWVVRDGVLVQETAE